MKKTKPIVAIIGCGMAGIACAYELNGMMKSEEYEILMLEGRERVGGRLFSKCFEKDDFPVDIGACWIEGTNNNPVADLCEKYGFSIDGHWGVCSVHDFDGKKFSYGEVKKLKRRLKRYIQSAGTYAWRSKKDVSLEKAMTKRGYMRGLNKREQKILRHCQGRKEQVEGIEFTKVSGRQFAAGPVKKGDCGFVKKGLGVLVEAVHKDLTKTTTKFGHVVTKICHGKEKVTIHTEQHGSFECDYCVATLPLGVLQRKEVEFSPRLPKKKRKSINRIGMGLMNKIVLVFEKKFWKDSSHATFEYIDDKVKGRWPYFLSLSEYWKGHESLGILVGLVTGEFALSMEAKSDKEVLADAMEVIRTIFSRVNKVKPEDIPEPSDFHYSRWDKDRFSRGGYCYFGIGSSMDDIDRLADNVGERLYFAGEHCSHFYSELHGAYISGRRMAKKIAQKLKVEEKK